MTPRLIGYFPKHTHAAAPGHARVGVEEIGSLGHYTGDGPCNWTEQYRHNEMWLYDSEAIARKVIADALEIVITPDPNRDPPWLVTLKRAHTTGFDFYAYKLFPVRFKDGQQEPFDPPCSNVVPLPRDYQPLGYDVVNKTCCVHFECSPLFCNGMADEIPVNRYCLLDDPDRALEIGSYFSVRKPEPGTYYVVEVWRKARPGVRTDPETHP